MKKFTEETNEFLVGIKFNNNKEWFHEHKSLYQNYVHEPMSFLASQLCDKFNAYDNSQILLPRVSRANRDIRFSNNKMPYKITKWFFLRTNTSSKIWYKKPTIYFEASLEGWTYGFYYHSSPTDTAKYRSMIYANTSEAEGIVDFINNQDFFQVEGDMYKRVFNKDVSDKVNFLAQRKWFGLSRFEDYSNTDFYSENLCEIIFEKIKEIYPVYKFINKVEI